MRRYFAKWEGASSYELDVEGQRRLSEFLAYACANSDWYRNCAGTALVDFPLLEKDSLIRELALIRTIDEEKGVISLTGGTTGASMKVVYRPGDVQERNALLDHFRATYGYELGKKVAWFSGKDLATQEDVDRGRCYRDDHRNRIRFFSTFLINRNNFDSYWNALREFQPRFMVGFPSSVLDIAMYARERGLTADWKVDVMFPTAETVLPVHRDVIGEVFGCRLVNQYASSEGAPFILECPEGRLHIHPLSGVFEVLDENGETAHEGEMVVTSLSTRGTHLIRYRIGERMRLALSDDRCGCTCNFPLVEELDLTRFSQAGLVGFTAFFLLTLYILRKSLTSPRFFYALAAVSIYSLGGDILRRLPVWVMISLIISIATRSEIIKRLSLLE